LKEQTFHFISVSWNVLLRRPFEDLVRVFRFPPASRVGHQQSLSRTYTIGNDSDKIWRLRFGCWVKKTPLIRNVSGFFCRTPRIKTSASFLESSPVNGMLIGSLHFLQSYRPTWSLRSQNSMPLGHLKRTELGEE
jgi:hypothetical protein